MKILYINHYAGSLEYGMEFRPYYFAKIWKELGYQVLIVAASYSHLRKKQPCNTDGTAIKYVTNQSVEGVNYRWYPTSAYEKNGIKRMWNMSQFLMRLWLDSQNLLDHFYPDVIIASSTYPMDIWVAHYLAKLAKAKLIFEVHDLWPLSPIELHGISPKHPFIRICQVAENYAYRHSNAVVSMAEKAEPYMKEHGLGEGKFYYMPNGIVEEDWQPENIDLLTDSTLKQFLLAQKQQGKIIVGYAGSHGQPNALSYLLEAAKLVLNQKIVFVLVGSGLEKSMLVHKRDDEEIDNIFFFDPIPKKQIPDLLAFFDIAYIGWRNVSIYRFGISPNKLMDYMMAKCPILHSVCAGNDPVQEAGCGITVAPENPQAIADGIMQLANLSKEDRATMGERGREFILKNQTYSVLAKQFLEVMQS